MLPPTPHVITCLIPTFIARLLISRPLHRVIVCIEAIYRRKQMVNGDVSPSNINPRASQFFRRTLDLRVMVETTNS